jgi:hypothetical protein
MKRNTSYVILILALAAGVVAIKPRLAPPSGTNESSVPAVVLVTDLREADSPNDTCARIIQAVREARNRGISVTELMPDSDSALLKNHRIVVAPTVLVLDKDGRELSRFEGESVATLEALRLKLKQLPTNKQ